MNDTTYNGRTNRATWLVGMRYNPETLEDVDFAEQDIDGRVEELDGFIKDLIDTSEINWEEIRNNIED